MSTKYEHREPQKTSDGNEKRNIWGRPILPGPEKVKSGSLRPDEYKDGVGKQVPGHNTTLDDGITPKYASDGLSQDWFDTHSRDEKLERGTIDGAGRRLGRR